MRALCVSMAARRELNPSSSVLAWGSERFRDKTRLQRINEQFSSQKERTKEMAPNRESTHREGLSRAVPSLFLSPPSARRYYYGHRCSID